MPNFFADRVVLITGASSGIGRALALLLGQNRAKVGLTARRGEQIEELAKTIIAAGGRAAYATADVANREQLQQATQKIRSELGPIDLLIANAGVGMPTFLDPLNIQDVERMIQVNVLGVILCDRSGSPGDAEAQIGSSRGDLQPGGF